jgi:tetratricopeptide (TPR) repeat protein
MGGRATFTGTRHQSGVIALIAVHILAGRSLRWLGLGPDVPKAVSGETGGLGDDASVELESAPTFEVQAKHGMGGGAALDAVVDRLRPEAGHSPTTALVLAVDRTSTSAIQIPLRDDLNRLRVGRADGLGIEAQRLVDRLGDEAAHILSRLYIAIVDVDTSADLHGKLAVEMLAGQVLADPAQAEAAWATLVTDAETVSANKERRDATSLGLVLRRHGFELRAPSADTFWKEQLDATRDLAKGDQPEAALAVLLRLQQRLNSPPASPTQQQRLLTQIALRQLDLGQKEEARTSARKALDIEESRPALYAAAMASYQLGDLEAADRLARRAIDADPNAIEGWIPRSLVAAARGEAVPTPPDAVTSSPQFQAAMANLALIVGDWEGVERGTALALQGGERQPEVLLMRSQAMLNAAAPDDPVKLGEAVELATDVIESAARPETLARALLLRGDAYRRLDRLGEATADIQRARSTSPTNRDTMFVAAEHALATSQFDSAAAILNALPADVDPVFLPLQAELLMRQNDADGARAKLGQAVDALETSRHEEVVRVKSAVVATEIGDLELATELLAHVPTEHAESRQALLARAQLAIAKGDFGDAIALFRRVAEADPEARVIYLHELARRLYRAEQPALAADVLAEVDLADMGEESRHLYATSLFNAGRLPKAQAVIDEEAKSGELPSWALGISAEIALRAEDTPRAIGDLTRLVEEAPESTGARIQLARLLLQEGRAESARQRLDEIAVDRLTPIETLMVAQLRIEAGQLKEGWSLGFAAFRSRPNDPDVERGVASLIFPPRSEDVQLVVGPDTFVELRSKGETEQFYVCADGPFDSWRHEISVEEAEARGLLGKRVGDEVVTDPGDWREQHWTIQRVVPAVYQIGFEIVSTFNERHPDEAYLGEKFSISNELSGLDLVPFIATLGDRRKAVKAVLDQHRKTILPLGFLATRLGVSIPELTAASRMSPGDFGPLLIEWPTATDQAQATVAATGASEVVLTTSAVDSAQRLGLLDRLATAYECLTPRSLLVELETVLREAEERTHKGASTMWLTDDGRLAIDDLEANDPRLVAQEEAARAIHQWVATNAKPIPRPLELLGIQESDVRDKVGRSSYDALELATARQVPLYADDLGLRRFRLAGRPMTSFSTVTLLPAFVTRRLLESAERDELWMQLVVENHAYVRPTGDMITKALARNPPLPQDQLQRVFDLLGQQGMSLPDAAALAMTVVKREAMERVQRHEPAKLTELAMEGMARQWPVTSVAGAIQSAARGQLALLPQHLSAVEDASRAWAKRRLGA